MNDNYTPADYDKLEHMAIMIEQDAEALARFSPVYFRMALRKMLDIDMQLREVGL